MLSTIRNLLIWISINVLQIQCLMFWNDEQKHKSMVEWAMSGLQVVNFCMWFFFSLGDGSSLYNSDFNLGYNCMIMDWMVMSGILLTINIFSATISFFKVERLDFEIAHFDPSDSRRIKSTQDQRTNIIIIATSGFIGSLIMFTWDYLAYNNSVDRRSCENIFSGDTAFRNILCFLLKIISMQLNPSAIYYAIYYSRKEDFEDGG